MRRSSPARTAFLAAALALVASVALTLVAHAGPTKSGAAAAPRAAATPGVVTSAPPVNDVCSGAIVIPCGTFNLSGNTDQANNDYTFPSDSLSCTGYVENGRDVVYRINAVAGDSLWIDLTSNTTDASIYLITNCSNPAGSCVVGDDSTDVGGTETLRYKFPSNGTYFLIIDSFGDNVGGAWIASGQLICVIQPPPPANDACNTPGELAACSPFSFTGNTEFATNDYAFPSAGASCFNSTAAGRDVVYRFTVAAGDSMWANYTTTTDGAVYIVADCGDVVSSCVTGVDVNGTGVQEQLRYRFSFGGTYYLVLDSKSANTFGAWSLQGGIVCPVVTPANDICERAIPLPCGPFSRSGSTAFGSTAYNFNSEPESCTGYFASGRSVVYKFYVTPGDSLWVDYTNQVDGSIYVVTNCNDVTGSCVAGADETGTGETEQLRHRFTSGGTYYLFLDSFGANTGGPFTMVGSMICANTDVPLGAGEAFQLGAISPNPFRGATRIPFALGSRATVTLRMIDLQGRVVRTLVDGSLAAGQHEAAWDGRDDSGLPVRAGVYFARLTGGAGSAVRRAILVR
jgi:hypothetical protein